VWAVCKILGFLRRAFGPSFRRLLILFPGVLGWSTIKVKCCSFPRFLELGFPTPLRHVRWPSVQKGGPATRGGGGASPATWSVIKGGSRGPNTWVSFGGPRVYNHTIVGRHPRVARGNGDGLLFANHVPLHAGQPGETQASGPGAVVDQRGWGGGGVVIHPGSGAKRWVFFDDQPRSLYGAFKGDSQPRLKRPTTLERRLPAGPSSARRPGRATRTAGDGFLRRLWLAAWAGG